MVQPPNPDPTALPAAEPRTLLFTDMVSSTSITERLGDARWMEIGRRHDRVVRECFHRHGGTEIDKSDGYLVLFDRPIQALRMALEYQAMLAEDAEFREVGLSARAAIHFGEVILLRNSPEEVQRGAKPVEVEGLAKPIGARVMSLASGGQVLLTRAAFDFARRASTGSEAVPAGTEWMAHGRYELQGVGEPVEVFEAGVRGVAPLRAPADSAKVRRILSVGEADMLGWRPAPAGAIPGRENWVLADKLGEGGFGEVWRAHHRKTREARIFKFCFDADRLRGLKREVTLFRLLKDTLGDRRDIARVLDWSFDAPPYFIEGEYTSGGDMRVWAESQGGLAAVPLAQRLELVAQVASALAAAHGVGVLHKDIKPSNVLISEPSDGALPFARLTDFGIGVITDRERLLEAGVTDTGLTETQLGSNDSSRTGTRLFMAPELIEGKPATIKSDIYALGVLLYQTVVGDFGRVLTADWREEIADDILREDIEACVAGDASRRLGSAEDLARRLRTQDARREERARHESERARAAAALAALDRNRKRRRILVVAVSILSAMLLVVGGMYRNAQHERRQAEVARLEAEAQRVIAENQREEADRLIAVMLEDLHRRLERIGRLDALEPVSRSVVAYYGGIGHTGSELGLDALRQLGNAQRLMGSVYESMGQSRGAVEAYNGAVETYRGLMRSDPQDIEHRRRLLETLSILAVVYGDLGLAALADETFDEALALGDRLPPEADPEWTKYIVAHSLALARKAQYLNNRRHEHAAREAIRRSMAVLEAASPKNEEEERTVRSRRSSNLYVLGTIERDMWRYDEAMVHLTAHLEMVRAFIEEEPDNAAWLADLAHAHYAISRTELGRGNEEAQESALFEALRIRSQLVEMDPTNMMSLFHLGYAHASIWGLQADRGNFRDAREHVQRHHEIMTQLTRYDPANLRWQRALVNSHLAKARLHGLDGDAASAQEECNAALEIAERLHADDPENPNSRMLVVNVLGELRGNPVDAADATKYEALSARGIGLLESVLASDPDNLTVANELADWMYNLETFRANRGDATGRLAASRRHYGIRSQSAARFPEAKWLRWSLGSSAANLGWLEREQGNAEEALRFYREALEIFDELLRQSPGDLYLLGSRGWARSNYAVLALSRGDLTQAAALHTGAIDDYQAILAASDDSTPADILAERNQRLAVELMRLGNVEKQRHSLEKAVQLYKESLSLLRAQRASDPSIASLDGITIWGYGSLLKAELDLDNLDGALEAALAGHVLATDALERRPEVSYYLGMMGLANAWVGDAWLAHGESEKALAAYEAARQLQAAICERDPANVFYQRQLALSEEGVGSAHALAGRPGEANDAYASSHARRTLIRSKDPDSTIFRLEMARLELAIGRFHAAQENPGKAEEHLNSSLGLLEQLVADAPEHHEAKVQLVLTQYHLSEFLAQMGRFDEAERLRSTAAAHVEQFVANGQRLVGPLRSVARALAVSGAD